MKVPSEKSLSTANIRLVLCLFLSSLGNALTIPFFAVYLQREFGTRSASIALALPALGALSAYPFVPRIKSRLPVQRQVTLGAMLAAVSFVVMAIFYQDRVVFGASLYGYGIVNGVVQASLNPLLKGVVDRGQLTKIYSLRYLGMYVAILIGGFLGSWASTKRPGIFVWLLVFNAVTFVVLGLEASTFSLKSDPRSLAASSSILPKNSKEARLLLYQLFAVMGGFGLGETTLPMWVSDQGGAHVQEFLTTWILVGTASAIILQFFIGRILAQSSHISSLKYVSYTWLAGGVVGLTFPVLSKAASSLVIVALISVLLSFGSTIYDAHYFPLLMESTEGRELELSSAASLTWSSGLFIAPLVGGLMLSLSGEAIFAVLVCASLLMLAALPSD